MILPLPYEELMYRTPLSATEIHQKLANLIETKNVISRSSLHLLYRGKLKDNEFKINRVFGSRASPVITGNIQSSTNGCLIKIFMRLIIPEIISMILLLSFAVAGFIFSLGRILWEVLFFSTIPDAWLIAPLFFFPIYFAATYFLFTLAFKSEAKQSKLFLQDLFQAELITEESA